MAHQMALCSERHYMGSAASGRYATDRSVGPSYERLPAPELLAHGAACSRARLTRYVREQDVLWWVAECQDAKDELAWGAEKVAALEALLEERADGQVGQAGPQAPTDPQRVADALERLRARMDAALARRREASRQLRLIGVSPKAQARIVAELHRRARKG